MDQSASNIPHRNVVDETETDAAVGVVGVVGVVEGSTEGVAEDVDDTWVLERVVAVAVMETSAGQKKRKRLDDCWDHWRQVGGI